MKKVSSTGVDVYMLPSTYRFANGGHTFTFTAYLLSTLIEEHPEIVPLLKSFSHMNFLEKSATKKYFNYKFFRANSNIPIKESHNLGSLINVNMNIELYKTIK